VSTDRPWGWKVLEQLPAHTYNDFVGRRVSNSPGQSSTRSPSNPCGTSPLKPVAATGEAVHFRILGPRVTVDEHRRPTRRSGRTRRLAAGGSLLGRPPPRA